MAQQNGISCIIGFILAIPFVGVSFAKDTFLLSPDEKFGEWKNMGLLKILKDVVVITATVAAVSTIAAPLWMLANNLDDEEIWKLWGLYWSDSTNLKRRWEIMGLFRKVLAAPFYGYAGICAVAAIACPPVLALAAASALTGEAVSGKKEWGKICYWPIKIGTEGHGILS